MQTFDVTILGSTYRVLARSRGAAFLVAADLHRERFALAPQVALVADSVRLARPKVAW